MKIGKLEFKSVKENLNLVASPIIRFVKKSKVVSGVYVAKINPDFADTETFCREYGIGLEVSTNCLVVEARRADKIWYAACLIMAEDNADINGIVRKTLDARKISFAPMDKALTLTGMEYGGITPIGLPDDFTIFVDSKVMENEFVVVGGGIRGSKIAVETSVLRELPNVLLMDIAKGR